MNYVCGKCRLEQSEDQFYKNPNCKDGINRSECKTCRKWYVKENRERNNEQRRRWREAHPHAMHDYNAQYYKENKERNDNRVKEWIAANPERRRAQEIQRHERRKRDPEEIVKRRARYRRWYQKNKSSPLVLASVAVKAAIKSGLMVRGPCEICGTTLKVEAHHHKGYDLAHWFDVRWLCRKHHMAEHGKVGY